MHGGEKSDSAIVARKPTNKAGRSAAEWVERRAGAEGNADQQSTRRAQDRASVSQALAAYGKRQGTGRRNGSPRSFTTSTRRCCGRHFTASSETLHQAWMD